MTVQQALERIRQCVLIEELFAVQEDIFDAGLDNERICGWAGKLTLGEMIEIRKYVIEGGGKLVA